MLRSSFASPFVQLPLSVSLGLTLLAPVHATMVAPSAGSVSFNWYLTAENSDTQTFEYVNSGDADPVFSSGGVRTAQSGNVIATVSATVDPYNGVFKSNNTAQTGSASRPVNIAESSTRLDLNDTLRISGPGATTTVTFRMSYDSVFSGLGLSPFDAGDLAPHFLQADSSRWASLSYQLPNPAYDPNAECTGSGELTECGIETVPFFTQTSNNGVQLFREWAQSERGFVYSNGDAVNGRYTGEVLLTMEVPTDVDLTLSYTVFNSARCFRLSNCDVGVDASHSDHIGLELNPGYTFVSASGFAYKGLAAAVPEPTSMGLMLAGLLGMAVVASRKRLG